MKFSAVILAGGQSSRMGRDKAFLEYRGRPLLAHQLATVEALQPAEIFISGRPSADYGAFGYPVLHDAFPNCGPLAGIERALAISHSPLLLVLAVDMPSMRAAFLKQMLSRCTNTCGVVPRLAFHAEPLAAIYPATSHRVILTLLSEGFIAARHFAEACTETGLTSYFETQNAAKKFFANWNRPGDIERK